MQELQEFHIGILCRLVRDGLDGRRLLINGIEGRQTEVAKLVEIQELGVREESQFLVEVESVLLLALLHSLVVGRRDGVQVIEVLSEVGGAAPVEVGHFDRLYIRQKRSSRGLSDSDGIVRRQNDVLRERGWWKVSSGRPGAALGRCD